MPREISGKEQNKAFFGPHDLLGACWRDNFLHVLNDLAPNAHGADADRCRHDYTFGDLYRGLHVTGRACLPGHYMDVLSTLYC